MKKGAAQFWNERLTRAYHRLELNGGGANMLEPIAIPENNFPLVSKRLLRTPPRPAGTAFRP